MVERAKRRMEGFVPKEIWVRPEHWPQVKRYLERLAKRRNGK